MSIEALLCDDSISSDIFYDEKCWRTELKFNLRYNCDYDWDVVPWSYTYIKSFNYLPKGKFDYRCHFCWAIKWDRYIDGSENGIGSVNIKQ